MEIIANHAAIRQYTGTPQRGSTGAGHSDAYAGSVESTPSFMMRGKLLRAVGALTLASMFVVGCTPPPSSDAPTHSTAQSQSQPTLPAPPTACDQLKTLSAQPRPTDSVLAEAATADINLARANCQVEIANRQAEATAKLAAAAEKQAKAEEQQAKMAKDKQTAEAVGAAVGIAAILGAAVAHSVNSNLK